MSSQDFPSASFDRYLEKGGIGQEPVEPARPTCGNCGNRPAVERKCLVLSYPPSGVTGEYLDLCATCMAALTCRWCEDGDPWVADPTQPCHYCRAMGAVAQAQQEALEDAEPAINAANAREDAA